jgi:DNA-binding NtrC family response regulator
VRENAKKIRSSEQRALIFRRALVLWSADPNEEERRGLSGENLNGQLTRLVSELVRRGVTLEQARNEFEKQFILASLKSHEGNFSRSAKFLGVHRNTLRNKIATLGMSETEFAEARGEKKRRARVTRPRDARGREGRTRETRLRP